MNRFPIIPIAGLSFSVKSLHRWCTSYSESGFDCPFGACNHESIASDRFSDHVQRRCSALSNESQSTKSLLVLLVKHMSDCMSATDPLLIIDICSTTNSCVILYADGSIQTQTLGSFNSYNLRRLYNRLIASASSGWRLLIAIVHQTRLLHSAGDTLCTSCAVVPAGATEAIGKALSDLNPPVNVPKRAAGNARNTATANPHTTMTTPTSAATKSFIIKNLAGTSNFVAHFSSPNRRSPPPVLSTAFQCIRILVDPTRAALSKLKFGRLLTLQPNFDHLLSIIVKQPARLVDRKITCLKQIMQYLLSATDRTVREDAGRHLSILKSNSYSRFPRQEANAFKSDQKMRRHMLENGSFLSRKEMTDVGEVAYSDAITRLSRLEKSNDLNHAAYHDMQTTVLVCLMFKGACYRVSEFRNMLLPNLIRKSDGTWRCFVAINKNRGRKQRGAFLFFGKQFDALITRVVNLRLRLQRQFKASKHDYLFVSSSTNSPSSTQDFNSRVKLYCNYIFGHFTQGNPQTIRFLQCAHLWSLYKKGVISNHEFSSLCVTFDHSMEVWETSYAFSDNVLDRDPGNDNCGLLWMISTDNHDEEISEIATLDRYFERTGVGSFTQVQNTNSPTSAPIVPVLAQDHRPHSNWWFDDQATGLFLSLNDKQDLESKGYVSDSIVTASAVLLHKQRSSYSPPFVSFTSIGQDDSNGRPVHVEPFKGSKLLQPVFINGNHWVLISVDRDGEGYCVKIYDSICPDVNTKPIPAEITRVCSLLLGKYAISYAPCMQQPDSVSCGLFVVANMAQIFNGSDVRFDYDVAAMRNHLLHCLDRKKITPFPTTSK
jgi:hypothetical protein